jgi:hypothetical protein
LAQVTLPKKRDDEVARNEPVTKHDETAEIMNPPRTRAGLVERKGDVETGHTMIQVRDMAEDGTYVTGKLQELMPEEHELVLIGDQCRYRTLTEYGDGRYQLAYLSIPRIEEIAMG